jgi:hypothetical protein
MGRSSAQQEGPSIIGGLSTRIYVVLLFFFLHMNLNVFVFTNTNSFDESFVTLIEFFLHSVSYFGLLAGILLVVVPFGQDLDEDEHAIWKYKAIAVGIFAFGYAIVSEVAKFLVFGESLAGSLDHITAKVGLNLFMAALGMGASIIVFMIFDAMDREWGFMSYDDEMSVR